MNPPCPTPNYYTPVHQRPRHLSQISPLCPLPPVPRTRQIDRNATIPSRHARQTTRDRIRNTKPPRRAGRAGRVLEDGIVEKVREGCEWHEAVGGVCRVVILWPAAVDVRIKWKGVG